MARERAAVVLVGVAPAFCALMACGETEETGDRTAGAVAGSGEVEPDAPSSDEPGVESATFNVIIDELRAECLGRRLFLQDTAAGPAPSCSIVEASPGGPRCAESDARSDAEPAVAGQVRRRLEQQALCADASGDCLDFQLCEIAALTPGSADYESCLESDTPTGDGWCYIDPAEGLGSAEQVASCPEGQERRIRFVGSAAPHPGTVTFFACAASPQSSE